MNVILNLRASNMDAGKGKGTCMLEFKSDVKLTSEEFVKVFKEFDQDGKNTRSLYIVNALTWILFKTRKLKKYGTDFTFPFLFSGNGYIEADELNQFLVTLLQETGNEVR